MSNNRKLKESHLLLLEEKHKRRSEDPLYSFIPNKAQKPFIECKLSEAWLISANRVGKTKAEACIISSVAREGMGFLLPIKPSILGDGSLAYDKAASIWASSLDFPHSRDVMQPYIFDNGVKPPGVESFIPNREIARWNADDQILKLKNGSLIGFKSAESGRVKYSGAAKDLVILDEEHPKGIIDEIIIRVPAGRRLYIRGGATLLPPEGIVGGVTWLYPEIIQPFLRGENHDKVWVFGGSIYDNPHLEKSELERLESRYPLGHPERRIRLGGEWIPGLAGARAYGNFSYSLHVNTTLKVEPRIPLAWMWDFNVDPFITLVGQIIPSVQGRRIVCVYREFVLEGGNIGDMCQQFRAAYPTHSAEIFLYGDATGQARSHQTNKSSWQMVLESLQTYPVPAKLKVPERNPDVVDRKNAVNVKLKSYGGIIGVQIHPACKELIADLEQVLVDDRGGIKKSSNRRDPYYRRTHSSDELGYLIAFEDPVQAISTPKRQLGSVATPGYRC